MMRSALLLFALVGTTVVVGTVVGADWLLLGGTALLAVRSWGAGLLVLVCAAFLALTSMVLLLTRQAQRTRERFQQPPREEVVVPTTRATRRGEAEMDRPLAVFPG